jgi:hypothetical protein
MDYGHVTPSRDAVLDRIAELEAGRERLIRKLRRSVAILGLWPEAFAHGPCTSRLRTGDGGRLVCLEIRDGAGKVRTFANREIPACLMGEFTSE